MTISIDKFITNSSQSLLSRLTADSSSIDQALSLAGSTFTRAASRDTGGDGIISNTTDYVRDTDGLPPVRLATKDEKTVEEEVATTDPKSLVYPTGLPHDFRMEIEMMDYKRPTPGVTAKTERSLFIGLPLPQQLIDQKSVSYSTDELGLVGALADAMAIASSKDNGNNPAGTAAPAGVTAARTAGAAGAGAIAARTGVGFATRTLAGIAAAGFINGETAAVASQLTGAQLNPNLSVTFRGPKLRNHTFTWEFAPHSADESRTLREILEELQARSLPSMTQKNSTGILTYPQMCQITLQPETYPFKKAVIESLNINYAPAGAPSYFHGTKEPTVIHVTMQLVEIEYFLSEDYGGATGKGLNSDISDIAKGLWSQFTDAITGSSDEEDTTDNE